MTFFFSTLLACGFHLGVAWGCGRWIGGTRLPACLRPGLGLAAGAILANVAYTHGVPLPWVGRILAAVALLGALPDIMDLFRRKLALGSGAIPLVVAGLLVAPVLAGGAQFALFQANLYDQFNYLASAVVRSGETYATVAGAGPADFIRNPLLCVAHMMADSRPAVVDFYATIEGLFPGRLHEAGYGFLCACLLATYLALAAWFQAVSGCTLRRAQILAAGVVLGFWGQLQIDLNSWSWAAASAPLTSAIALLQLGLNGTGPVESTDLTLSWRWRTALAVCLAGLLYLYPEVLGLYGPALVGAVGLLLMARPELRPAARPLAGTMVLTFLVSLPQLRTLIEFGLYQYFFATSVDYAPLDWMWQSITGGPLEGVGAGAAALRWLSGGAGLGWLSGPGGPPALAGLLTLTALGVVGAALAQDRELRRRCAFSGLVMAFLLAGLAVLFCLGQRWIAAKGVSYAATLWLPLLLLPAAVSGRRWSAAPAWCLFGLGLVFGGIRIGAARDPAGIHNHGSAYPAVTDASLKESRRWVTPNLRELRTEARLAKIDIPDVSLETYAMICLQAEGVPFFKGLPVYAYWGFGDKHHGLQPPRAGYDTLAYVEYDGATGHAALAFARTDGRVLAPPGAPHVVELHGGHPLDTRNSQLAWTLRPVDRDPAGTLSIETAKAQSIVLEFGLLTTETQRGTILSLRRPSAAAIRIPLAGLGLHTVQGVRVPFDLPSGISSIEFILGPGSATSEVSGSDVIVVNPRILGRRGAQR